MSEAIDFLTVTVPSSVGRGLLGRSEEKKPGPAGRGFKRREWRLCSGGDVLRAWEPVKSSKRWGREYESWEWAGSASDWWAEQVAAVEVRPSRVDIAWDFLVPSAYLADDWARAVEPYVKGQTKPIKTGSSGEGGVYTHYVGAMKSDRRVRCYRKDLQSWSWAEQFGETLRVELILKGKQAQAWWGLWKSQGRAVAFAAAAGVVESLTGFKVRTEATEAPQCLLPEGHDECERIADFLRQFGATFLLLHESGLDVLGLVRSLARPRQSVWRDNQRKKVIAELGADYVQRQVEALLGFGRAVVA